MYSNYEIDSKELSPDEEWYGIDFGYTVPTAVIRIHRRGGELHIREMVYQTHLTNQDLIGKLSELNISTRAPIYADSAEPGRIEEIYRAGYNIYPAEKKVDDGIDSVNRHMLHIHPDSTNLLKELQTYKWREDKNGNVTDVPVKFNDHLCDALRYAIHTHLIDDDKQIAFIPRGH